MQLLYLRGFINRTEFSLRKANECPVVHLVKMHVIVLIPEDKTA